MNVILYTRVSTDEQKKNGYSLQYQEERLKAYCQYHNYNVVAVYTEDCSGKNFNRPQWKSLYSYIKANKRNVDCILFLRWDRFARNLTDSLVMIDKLKRRQVKVNAIDQPIDADDVDSLVLLSIYLAVPQTENQKNSIRTTEGMRKARLEGWWTGTPPWGYKNHRTDEGKSTLRIVEERAAIVKHIFHQMSLGIYSAEELWKTYKAQGLMKLSKQAFLNLLRNVVYIGKICVPEYKSDPAVIAHGNHPPIVSEEVFYKVQRLLLKKAKIRIGDAREDLYPLKRLLLCPTHGKFLTASRSRSRNGAYHHYYHCSRSDCKCRYKLKDVHDQIASLLQSIQISQEVVNLYEKILMDVFKKADVSRTERLEQKTNELTLMRQRQEKLQDQYLDGVIPPEDYVAMRNRFSQAIKTLEVDILLLNGQETAYGGFVKKGVNLLTNLTQAFEGYGPAVKRKIVGSIFPENFVFDGKKFRTTRVNQVLPFMGVKISHLEIEGNEKAGENSGLSSEAPPAGLEPATL